MESMADSHSVAEDIPQLDEDMLMTDDEFEDVPPEQLLEPGDFAPGPWGPVEKVAESKRTRDDELDDLDDVEGDGEPWAKRNRRAALITCTGRTMASEQNDEDKQYELRQCIMKLESIKGRTDIQEILKDLEKDKNYL